ncbi:uncharacterized protein (DUF2249 family) [Arthrobacter silviterrae]|uniref:DUF2249 domain-containing protein n=1 Tax=Arthrobacter silviterrae TaxID=2026658 RepID=A0ABX0D6E3_9MICC|nr:MULTISPECIES: DUF2249 domain-containing protein [Arthrobacter]MCU6480602.1 DUF2249 domain-containing protein [Arthrobacter sp. A2-55]MDQ0278481.1 uncharacterized protein (DUF2249 family) [Arthrobacter silviterrae]NGN82261.1 DUF2249 domain-containing protein [Arthrobacter silviterrae]
MNNLVLASSSTEAEALEAAKTRLAEAGGTLGTLALNLLSAVAGQPGGELAGADQTKLVDFAEQELLPVAAAFAAALAGSANSAEKVLAAVAAGHSARLVDATKSLEVEEAPVKVLYAGARLQEAAAAFLDHATELIVPALAQNPALKLTGILPQRTVDAAAAAPAKGGCACGGHDEPGLSELDTRVIPHAIRHATIFGALEGLSAGKGILLVANHNPLPLLAQLEQRSAGKFTVSYVEDGPETWKLSMVRN